MLQTNTSLIIKFRINFTLLLLMQHRWKVAMSDKFKLFVSHANYRKSLFVNCIYLRTEILQKQFWIYIDLFFINFVLIEKALAPHVLRNKLWKWPNCTFSLQIDENLYSHEWGYTELSSSFFPLKNHFKGNPL